MTMTPMWFHFHPVRLYTKGCFWWDNFAAFIRIYKAKIFRVPSPWFTLVFPPIQSPLPAKLRDQKFPLLHQSLSCCPPFFDRFGKLQFFFITQQIQTALWPYSCPSLRFFHYSIFLNKVSTFSQAELLFAKFYFLSCSFVQLFSPNCIYWPGELI